MNKDHLHNSSHSEVVFVYIKEGGFIEMRQKTLYDSFTKEITFVFGRENTFRITKMDTVHFRNSFSSKISYFYYD
jgi:hypothetical protein